MILIADGPLSPLTAARGRKTRLPPTQDGRRAGWTEAAGEGGRVRLRTVSAEELILQKSRDILPRPCVYMYIYIRNTHSG